MQAPPVQWAPVMTSAQLSPSQHVASVHEWSISAQLTGGVQIPPLQVSVALQQLIEGEQLSLVWPHTAADPHVPLVAPGAMSQESPAQQSAFTVQLPPVSKQALPGVTAAHRSLPSSPGTHGAEPQH